MMTPDGTTIVNQIDPGLWVDDRGQQWALDASGNPTKVGGGGGAAPPPTPGVGQPGTPGQPIDPSTPPPGGALGGVASYQDKLNYVQGALGRTLSDAEIDAGLQHFGGTRETMYGLTNPQLDQIVDWYRTQGAPSSGGPSGGGGGGTGAGWTGGPAGAPEIPPRSAYDIAMTGSTGTGPPAFQAPAYTPPPAFSYADWQAPGAFSYADFQAPTAEDVYKDPSYQFRYNQGMGALQNSAAARGVLGTGGSIKDFMSFGQDFASQEYGKAYDRAAQEYQANRGNAYQNYVTNWNNALQAYATNRAGAVQQYNTNYQTQYVDPFQMAYQNAQASLQPQELAYTTQIGAAQHARDQADLYAFNNRAYAADRAQQAWQNQYLQSQLDWQKQYQGQQLSQDDWYKHFLAEYQVSQ